MPGSALGDNAGGEDEVWIEVAAAEGLAEVQAMVGACGLGPYWPAEAWREIVRPPSGEGLGSLLLLAKGKHGELVGWLAASRVWERSELEYVQVGPAHRGRGLAGRLMDSWIEWASTQGVAELALEVRISNEEALRLYRRRGFAEQGRRPKYYQRPVEDALLMGRKL